MPLGQSSERYPFPAHASAAFDVSVPKVATCATFNSPRSSLIFFKIKGRFDGLRSISISL